MSRIRKKVTTGGKTRWYPMTWVDGVETPLGGYRTKTDAQARLKEVESQIADGSYGKAEAPTFGEFYENWIQAKEKSLKPSTLHDYKSVFEHHILPHFSKKRIDLIKPLDVQRWINGLELSPPTTGKVYRYFRGCIKQAEILDVIKKSPCRGVQLPRTNREELSYLAPEEVAALIQECRQPERTLFFLLTYSGLRLGEALALRWQDVDFEMNAIKVERSYSEYGGFHEPKTASSRRAVPMLPSLANTLRDYYHSKGHPGMDDLLFSLNGEIPLDQGNVRRRFYAALKAANLKHVSVHSLRHTFASVMLASGASIKSLQRALGHSSAMMTLDCYSHMMPETMDNILNKADALMSGSVASLKGRKKGKAANQ